MNNMKKILTKFYLSYLRFFAKIQLKKINPLVIGVGGASGKSSAAHFISLMLGEKYKVKQGKGKNSETGIPLNILNINIENYDLFNWLKVFIKTPFKILTDGEKFDYLVVEMGIDSPFPPKNMSYLLGIIRPDIGLLTNIYHEHSLYFDPLVKSQKDQERKKEIIRLTAEQEGMLLKSIDQSGISIVNLDDLYIADLLPLKSKTITISEKDKTADFYIEDTEANESSFLVNFIFLNEKYQIKIPAPLPKYYAFSIMFSVAVGFSCGLSIRDCMLILERNFTLPPGRFSVFKGIKNSTIFDSSYNSSLEPARGALELIKEIGKDKRKIGILGDMRELGSLSKIQHELLAKEIIRNLNYAILIGPLMNKYVAPILEKEDFLFEKFETFKSAREKILESVKKDDLILVKGSQNTLFLERAVEILLLDKKDKEKLCRRGSFWDKKRREA